MKRKTTIALAAGLLSSVFNLSGQNPIIQTCYTPDPAPYVHGDTLIYSLTMTKTMHNTLR